MKAQTRWRALALLVPFLGPGACFAEDEAPARGPELLAPFKAELQGALLAGMAEGPAAAIHACRVQAPRIAESLSVDGVRVGRASHRLRNPANTAPDWVAPILRQYLDAGAGAGPVTVPLSGSRAGYVEPIVTQPLCVTCHGTDVDPALLDTIRSLYPDDRAVGFSAGDLRGVFWVEYDAGD
jgi:hypothetical protein